MAADAQAEKEETPEEQEQDTVRVEVFRASGFGV